MADMKILIYIFASKINITLSEQYESGSSYRAHTQVTVSTFGNGVINILAPGFFNKKNVLISFFLSHTDFKKDEFVAFLLLPRLRVRGRPHPQRRPRGCSLKGFNFHTFSAIVPKKTKSFNRRVKIIFIFKMVQLLNNLKT